MSREGHAEVTAVRARHGAASSGAGVGGRGERRLSRRQRAHARNAAGAARGAGGGRCCRGARSRCCPPVSRAPPTRVVRDATTTHNTAARRYVPHVTHSASPPPAHAGSRAGLSCSLEIAGGQPCRLLRAGGLEAASWAR